MKRVQLFEFEDFSWFPESFRQAMTNLIIVFLKMMGTAEVIQKQIERIQKMHGFKRIIDLGSGSGGAMPVVVEKLNSENEEKIQLLLTDLHPSKKVVEYYNSQNRDDIHYKTDSLDATRLTETPEGLKTMINSFHHMPPETAKEILRSAKDNHEPLFIYELAENKIPTLIWALFLPIALPILIVMTWFMTPFTKPSWQQIVFTYLIPIIPICYAWDGQASYPRTYSFSDIEEMLNDLQDDTYDWEFGQAKNAKGKSSGYYILGLPK